MNRSKGEMIGHYVGLLLVKALLITTAVMVWDGWEAFAGFTVMGLLYAVWYELNAIKAILKDRFAPPETVEEKGRRVLTEILTGRKVS